MKAIICDSFGEIENLRFDELPNPVCGDDEVLIRVAYCGVNFPDTLIVQGKYQFSPSFPFVPGGEVSGEVEATGINVTKFKKGHKVLAAMGWGGFGELAVAKASNTFLIPAEGSQSASAALLETYATAIYALKDRGQLRSGETLVVLGAAGGTGTAAVQLGKQFGARVVACVSNEEKARFCLENGADTVVNYSQVDLKTSLKNLGQIDVIFDPVGGDMSEAAFRSLSPNGRHLVVGFASGKIPALSWNLPLLKSASVVGVFWGHFWRNFSKENAQNVKLLLKWLAEEKINPRVTKTYSLSEGKEALLDISNRKVIGKIVLEV